MTSEPNPTSDTPAARTPSKSLWQKTPYPNLIRYVPSGTYFARLKVSGKLIRRSLSTHVLEVAKLRVSDFLKDHRRFSANKAGAVKGEVVIELYRKETDNDPGNRPRTKLYKHETLIALRKTWPDLYDTDIVRPTAKDCREWASRYNERYSATRFNGALNIVRRIFEIAIEEGYRNDNPAKIVSRVPVPSKQLHLPTQQWWELLWLSPEQLRQQLRGVHKAAPEPPAQKLSGQDVAA